MNDYFDNYWTGVDRRADHEPCGGPVRPNRGVDVVKAAIVLFTRDLRVHDNPALAAAAQEAARIVPLFVFDAAILGSGFARPNRVAFLLDALRALDASLAARGGRLVVRAGDVVVETLALAREVGAEAVFLAEDASGYAQRRRQRLGRPAAATASHCGPRRA